ncbi:hypothetical protein LOK49_LG03G01493 [Camellia lanceoleosa]|uniref:Uncharacterized protein n=1 Tax=Camellia lanceoleosa TaxID=1840588 RepID=A0ACC0IAV8_9ERIC|nr:hypothetical protein LOK49_LG03G01493 [Camellia lanceoleosa]
MERSTTWHSLELLDVGTNLFTGLAGIVMYNSKLMRTFWRRHVTSCCVLYFVVHGSLSQAVVRPPLFAVAARRSSSFVVVHPSSFRDQKGSNGGRGARERMRAPPTSIAAADANLRSGFGTPPPPPPPLAILSRQSSAVSTTMDWNSTCDLGGLAVKHNLNR